MTGRTEHDGVALPPPTVGVRGRVTLTGIGLDLHDPDGHLTVGDQRVEQQRRDLLGGPVQLLEHLWHNTCQGTVRRVDADEILARRMTNLLLTRTGGTPAEVTDWFGALQAQDLASGKWSIGVRTGQTEQEVDASLADGEILRTWPMRGTIHLIHPHNARWLLDLTGSRAFSGVGKRWEFLGLERDTVFRAGDILRDALADGALTRTQCLAALNDAGISTDKVAYHLLWHTSQRGISCIGPNVGNEQSYVLLDQWAPEQREPEDPAALLATMYYRSHGPTTAKDFQGWTGLTMTVARQAIEAAGLDSDGNLFYFPSSVDPLPEALLLPGFDEYLLGFKDRTLFMEPEDMNAVVPGGNGMFRATAVHRGRVIGTWLRKVLTKKVVVTVTQLRPLNASVRQAFEAPALAYAHYVGKPVELVWA